MLHSYTIGNLLTLLKQAWTSNIHLCESLLNFGGEGPHQSLNHGVNPFLLCFLCSWFPFLAQTKWKRVPISEAKGKSTTWLGFGSSSSKDLYYMIGQTEYAIISFFVCARRKKAVAIKIRMRSNAQISLSFSYTCDINPFWYSVVGNKFRLEAYVGLSVSFK